jgi:hypothetical protein
MRYAITTILVLNAVVLAALVFGLLLGGPRTDKERRPEDDEWLESNRRPRRPTQDATLR